MTKKFNGTPAIILLVEDNPGDARLTEEALKSGKLHNELHHAADGETALRFLRREGEFQHAPRPDLILLDLNMPGMDGRELLVHIKADPKLAAIPVCVLTTSDADEDILRSYELHASCFVTKPVDFEKFIEIVQQIERFWFSIVSHPS